MKKILRKSLLWVGITVAFLMATAAWIVATETGTRWALNRALGGIAGLDIHDIRGTLLTNLEVGRIDYANPNVAIALRKIDLNIAWSRTFMGRLTLQHLAAGEIHYQNLELASIDPKPLEVPIPDIPLSIFVDAVAAQEVTVNGKLITEVTTRMLELHSDSLRTLGATANFSETEFIISDFSIRFDDDLSVDGQLQWQYSGGEWNGRATVAGSLSQLSFQHELLAPHTATAFGSVRLLNQTAPLIDATVRINSWLFDQLTVANGELVIKGTTDAYSATAFATVTNERSYSAEIQADGNGSSAGLEAVEVRAQSALGQVMASGSFAWSPNLALELQVTGEDIDLADFLPVAPGKLDTTFSIVASSPTDYMVNVSSLAGTYNNQDIHALGSFSSADTAYLCTDCELTVGQNSISFDGSLNDRNIAASFVVNANSLDHLWPELGGSIAGDGVLRGSVDLPILTGNATGNLISWRNWSIDTLTLHSKTVELDKVDLQLDIDGLAHGDSDFGRGLLRAEGDVDAIDVHLDWAADVFRTSARATIALDGDSISGTVSRANIIEPYSGTWKLSSPLEFGAGAGEIKFAANSWINGDAVLQHDRLLITGGDLQLGATLSNMPLTVANNALPERIRLGGFADVEISLRRQDETWAGDLRWEQNNTNVWLSQPDVQEFQIDVPVFNFDVHLDTAGATARAEIKVAPGLDGLLEVSVDDLSPESELHGRLQLSGSEWDWIPVLLPEIDDVQGEITADIRAEGSPQSPRLQGDIRWQQGQLAIPSLNAPLTNIDVTMTAASDDDAKFVGQATAGGGTLLVDGRIENIIQATRSFSVDLKGDNAELLNWPDYQLIASPDLNISGNAGAVAFNGKLDVEKAEISVRELPEGAVRPSADAVVTGETPEARSRVLLTGDVEVALSKNVHIDAFGLDSRLEGTLRFSQQETGKPRAAGKLELKDGVFGAYGQQLEIEKGTLTFTGPIDNPLVDVRAVRKIETVSGTVTVGIQLGGRAQNPSSTLFSSPAMSETDTLSYLVLGRALQSASTADGNQVADAAFALGVRQAALITNQIGLSLGLDELAIEGSNQSTVSLVAGKQINSRLYARYAYGVFARIGNLLLRYQLSERFTIEVGAGDSQSMDLLYIIKKK